MHPGSRLMETHRHFMNYVVCPRGYIGTRLATSLHNVFLDINLIQWRRIIGTVAGGSGKKLKSDNDFILTNNDLPDLTT